MLGGTLRFPLFTMKDLEEAVLSMKNEKMLGADGIPTEVYKLVFRHQSDLHTARCVQCLPEEAVFFDKIR